MARATLTIALIVLLNALIGCGGGDRFRLGSEEPIDTSELATFPKADETDIVEQMAANRQAYHRSLEALLEYYKKQGNNMKLHWARKELEGLDNVQQYNYILEATIAGPHLKATTFVPEADYLYRDALRLERKAKELVLFTNDELLRQALDKYNRLIKNHPSSDKIDDAAYHAGGIYEHFKDYAIAILYYQRAYQWNANIIHPAKFKAAYILDNRLHQRAEALELYRQLVDDQNLSVGYREYVKLRIEELTQIPQETE